jgi:hypothetical protein
MVLFESQDGGVAVGALAPLSGVTSTGTKVEIATAYPYGDDVVITVTATAPQPLYVRIPGWATAATATFNGNPIPLTAGSMSKVQSPGRPSFHPPIFMPRRLGLRALGVWGEG